MKEVQNASRRALMVCDIKTLNQTAEPIENDEELFLTLVAKVIVGEGMKFILRDGVGDIIDNNSPESFFDAQRRKGLRENR